MFDPTASVFVGMTTEQLQAALATAQNAYVELMTGTRGVEFTYSQGDGSKTVKYDKVDQAQLMMFIRMLQQQLGMNVQRRRPIRPLFGR